jgi:uncharacterized membrane protein YfcA
MEDILIVCVAAFAAGFIDAVVGGGGLVQTPVLFMMFAHYPVATLLGTTKLPSFSGTARFTVSIFQTRYYSMETDFVDFTCCVLCSDAWIMVYYIYQQCGI